MGEIPIDPHDSESMIVDQITMQSDYRNQVFYNLDNCEEISQNIKDKKYQMKLDWLAPLLESEKRNEDPVEFMSNIKDDLFPEEVFVFSPKLWKLGKISWCRKSRFN